MGACAALGSTSLYSSLFNLQSLNLLSINSASSDQDYKALVCIMLRGGNDGFNTLVPFDLENFDNYQSNRFNLALARESLLPISPLTYNQQELAFHPEAQGLQTLFDQKKLALVCNVGTLVEPVSKSEVLGNSKLPSGLFSHSDQAHHWQTSVPQSNSPTGWGGRLADVLRAANSNTEISMNISLAGKNVFQLGNEISEYSILPTGDGSIGIKGYKGTSAIDQLKTSMVKSLMEQQYQDIFKKTYADIVVASQNAHELFSGSLADSVITSPFSESTLSQSLKMVARTIKVRESLGMKRQCFFIQHDGWDHHRDLINGHAYLLNELSTAMLEFQEALVELDVEDQVCSFTISDFGRTLNSNGSGSDHAWGSHAMVMGGSVKGGDVYGSYPELIEGGDKWLEGGIIIPDISTDEYFAELALWFGISASEIQYVFPNISNFYSPMSGNAPIGFMKSS